MNVSLLALGITLWRIYVFAVIRTAISSVLPTVYGMAVGAAVLGKATDCAGWLLVALGLEAVSTVCKWLEDWIQTDYWAKAQIRQAKRGPGGPDAITRASWLTNRLDLVAWKLPEVIQAAGTLIAAPLLLVQQYGISALMLLVAWMLPAAIVITTRRMFEGWYLEAARNGEEFHRCLSQKSGVAEILRRRVRLWYKRFRTEESTKHIIVWWTMMSAILAAAVNPAGAAAFMVAAGRMTGSLKDVFEIWIEYVRVKGQDAHRNGS